MEATTPVKTELQRVDLLVDVLAEKVGRFTKSHE
jgi:hypothetical protein